MANPESIARTVASKYHIPGADREDLEQEALLAILQVADQPEGVRFNKARQRLQALWRAAKVRAALPLPETVATPPAPAQAVEWSESFGKLLLAVSAREAVILGLGFRQGMDDQDIATSLGTTVGAVHTARCRALARIRERLPDGY